jgi:hypothetical protein
MKATFIKDFAGIKKGSTADLSDYAYASLLNKGIIGDEVIEQEQSDAAPVAKKRGRKKAE